MEISGEKSKFPFYLNEHPKDFNYFVETNKKFHWKV